VVRQDVVRDVCFPTVANKTISHMLSTMAALSDFTGFKDRVESADVVCHG
jgi:hypothetical protein